MPVQLQNVLDAVNSLKSKVSRVDKAVSGMQGPIATIGKRVGDGRLVGAVDDSLVLIVDQMQSMLTFAQGAADDAREGLESFDAAAFRQRLLSLFANLRAVGAEVRRILLDTDPSDPLFEAGPMDRLIGRVPDAVLWPVARAVQPIGGLWDLTSQLAAQLSSVPSLDDRQAQMCDNLLKVPEVKVTVTVALRVVGFYVAYLDLVRSQMPDDLTLTGAVGAGGGTTIGKYPASLIVDIPKKLLELLTGGLKRILDTWAECEQRQAKEQIDRIEAKLDKLLAATPGA